MTQERWSAVDQYINDALIGPDPVLEEVLRASSAAGMPQIHVSPALGKLLHLLVRIQGARSVLEIGTLAGYSTIWLARALPPGGRVVTLEAETAHAEVARACFAQAGFSEVIDLRLGPAQQTLPQLVAEGKGPFDLIFIDADKPSYPEYFKWAFRLSRRGSVMVIDNVVRDGAVIDAGSEDARVQGVRRLNELIAAEPRVTATTIQTVGSKGYDGFSLVLVTAE